MCLSIRPPVCPWKAAAPASCPGDLMEIVLQLGRSQASPCGEMGWECCHLFCPVLRPCSRKVSPECEIFPHRPKEECIQSLSCNLGEIEALGSPNQAGECSSGDGTLEKHSVVCAYFLCPGLPAVHPDPRRQQSLLGVSLKSSWEPMLAGGSSLHCRGWCSLWCSLAGG